MASDHQKTNRPAIHPEMRSLLDRHREDAPRHKREIHDQLIPIIRAVSASLVHLAELEAQIHVASMSAHDIGLNHTLKWLEDEVEAVKHRGNLARIALKDYARAFENFETCLTRPEAAILRDSGVDLDAPATAALIAPASDAAPAPAADETQRPNKLQMRAQRNA